MLGQGDAFVAIWQWVRDRRSENVTSGVPASCVGSASLERRS